MIEISLKSLDEQAAEIKKLSLIYLNEGLQEVCMGKRDVLDTTFLTGGQVHNFLTTKWNYTDITPFQDDTIRDNVPLSHIYLSSMKKVILVVSTSVKFEGGVTIRFPSEQELFLVQSYQKKSKTYGLDYPEFDLSSIIK